jgi:hypothetical protein
MDNYLSIRDVLMHVCDLTPKRANEKWDRLSNDIKNELTSFCGQFRFLVLAIQRLVLTFKGVLRLIMLVSGEKAALYRSAMSKILQRYYAGDGSLTDEIQANPQSDAPIAQMARAALVAEAVPVLQDETTTMSLGNKRKLEELEIAKLEIELEARPKHFQLQPFILLSHLNDTFIEQNPRDSGEPVNM